MIIICLTIIICIFVFYLRYKYTAKSNYIFAVITNDCQELIEGVIRELLVINDFYYDYDIYVYDKSSQDETKKIIKKLARQYNFFIIENNLEKEIFFKDICSNKNTVFYYIEENEKRIVKNF